MANGCVRFPLPALTPASGRAARCAGKVVPTGASDKTAGESGTLAPCEFFFSPSDKR